MAIKKTKEIIRIASSGIQIKQPCAHVLNNSDLVIPGLDADFCKECRTWWIDQNMRDRLLNKRRKVTEDNG
jgi:Zn-finger nucleic acid-binding protein